MMKLEITENEREALLGLLEEELRDPKYPLIPEVEALRSVARSSSTKASASRTGDEAPSAAPTI